MAIGSILFVPAIATGDETAGDRRHRAAARYELLKKYHSQIQADAKTLSFGDMA